MLRDNATLLDIAKATRSVLAFIEGYDDQTFMKDEKTKSAVIHQMLIIGETFVARVSRYSSRHTLEAHCKDAR
jgi:uncharacterized protein with HEPN domain